MSVGRGLVSSGGAPLSRLVIAGIAAWLAVLAFHWPHTVSFSDELGYIGEARLLLDGRLRPEATDIGIWRQGPHGWVSQYPLLPSLLLAPLFALAPRAVFLLSVVAVVAICLLAARVLQSWGRSQIWALLILIHPTVIIVGRTAMADLPLCALMLGAWWGLRQDRPKLAAVLLAALCGIKPTGFMIAGAIGFGEICRRYRQIRAGEREARRAAWSACAGVAAGLVLVVAANMLTTGGPWFGYDHSFLGTPPFWPAYFRLTAPAQLRSVLLLPPLLILGVIPFWRRRELGPCFVIAGFGLLMCFYFFVDVGTTSLETIVLAPRLLLPVVLFLLIGYGELLDILTRRYVREVYLGAGLVVVVAVFGWIIGGRHQRWQQPAREALAAAVRLTEEAGTRQLVLPPQAAKAGMLFPGRIRGVQPRENDAAVILCSHSSGSYRAAKLHGAYSCAIPGYRPQYQASGFEVLIRERADAGGPNSPPPEADPRSGSN